VLVQTHFPRRLTRSRYDQYLASGWFRGSVMLYKMDLLCIDANVFSVVNIRLDLNKHTAKKRHRKIQRKVERQFNITCGPAKVTADKQRLYEQHKSRFKGFIHQTLDEYLYAGFHSTVFETMEICVYDDDRLIATSFFDLGDRSMASLLAIYDADYHAYSLGTYTMLKEIEFGKQTERKLYYPGYVLDLPSRFDYKLELGDMEYYTPGKRWGKFANFSSTETFAHQLRGKMTHLKSGLEHEEINFKNWFYPYFSMGYMPLWKDRFLHMPWVLELGHDLDGTLMAGFCPEEKCFLLCHVNPCPDEQHFINMEQANEFDNQSIYLGHLMEFGDRAFFSTLTELLHAAQLWQQRIDKLPPSCD
jgi:arginine-tRNA-protein transferase